MFKDKFAVPQVSAEEMKAHRDRFSALIAEYPWLIPATVSLEIIPVTVMIHGFWKNRQLKKQLLIEREHTKQRQLGGCHHGHGHGGHCHHGGGKPQLLAGPHHGHGHQHHDA